MQSIRFIIFSRLILVVTGYFALLAVVIVLFMSALIRQFVVEDSKSSLSFVVNNIRSNYFAQLRQMDDLARLPGFAPFDQAASARLVDDFLRFSSIIGTIHVYERDGDLLFAKRKPSIPPYRYDRNFYTRPQREFLRQAEQVLRDKKPSVSDTFYTSKGDLLQTYVVPILPPGSDGPAIGIISGGVFPLLHRLDHLVEGLTLSERNFILITDSKGNTVAKSGLPPELGAMTLSPFVSKAAAELLAPGQRKTNAVLVADADKAADVPYILLSSPIREMNLLVTFGVSTYQIESRKADFVRYAFMLLVLGLIVALGTAIIVGNRLSQPLIEIVNVLKRLTVGDVTARVGYAANDEIGYLGELINRLGAKIRKDRYLGELWSTDEEASVLLDEGDRPS